MLVLTRRIGEEVYVDGGRVKVVLLDVAGGWAILLADVLTVALRIDDVIDLPGVNCQMMCVRVGFDSVRLGFTAPPSVVIDREEIHHLKHGTTWRLTDGGNVTTQGGCWGAGGGQSDSGAVPRRDSPRTTV